VPIYTTTVASATPSVVFSAIPQTYTDLVLVCNSRSTRSATVDYLAMLVGNGSGDTGSHYSETFVLGNGSTTSSNKLTNNGHIELGDSAAASDTSGIYSSHICHIMNYSNTTTYKTTLGRYNLVGSGSTDLVASNVNLWRGSTGSSTEAINYLSISYPYYSSNIAAGSTFTLYGIKSA
jgi:hypothetical protein